MERWAGARRRAGKQSSYCRFCSFCAPPTTFRNRSERCYTSETPSKDAVTAAGTTAEEAMTARIRRLLRQRLSTQVVIMMVAILVVTMAAGFAVVQWNLNRQLDNQYEQRSLAVAQSLASQPGLQQ